jgi:Aromatic-ring-opening dioxygenase LigAB, LigA subunit
MNAHYFFPPAEAYALNRCLFRLKSEPAYRRRFVADRDAAMSDAALGPDARAALSAFDRDRLVALGAHPYLVFMADLRLKMERAPAAFEKF